MDTIFTARLVAAEIIINAALIVANAAMHLRLRRLLRCADDMWREAQAYKRQAERMLEEAQSAGRKR